MDTRSGPAREPGPGRDAVTGERRQLINLAYRLLGSLAEAEDAVQEAYARWYALPGPDRVVMMPFLLARTCRHHSDETAPPAVRPTAPTARSSRAPATAARG